MLSQSTNNVSNRLSISITPFKVALCYANQLRSTQIDSNRLSIAHQCPEMTQSSSHSILMRHKSSRIALYASKLPLQCLYSPLIDPNSSQIVTNCRDRLQIISNPPLKSPIVFNSLQMMPKPLHIVSRCLNWCHSVPKMVSKTVVMNPKVFLVAAHSIVLAQ